MLEDMLSKEGSEMMAIGGELNQVWTNIMDNALDAMPDGGTLTLTSQSDDDHVTITIADTGRGIPKENLSKIFEPFFTTKPKGEGTGLGLHNAKAIVEKYRGDLSVESTVGQGTTFVIELPNTTNQ